MSNFTNTDAMRKELMVVWKKILVDLKTDEQFSELGAIMGWLETVMELNVPFGKQSRAVAITVVYRSLAKERSPEMDVLVSVAGWIAEIFHTSALMADDIMDGSTVRRGKPAWYMRADVGMSAINDVLMLQNIAWRMIRKYFFDTEFYERFMVLCQDTVIVTILGQALDTRFSILPDTSRFTRSTYDILVKYKTSIYSFCCPVAIGMILGGVDDTATYEKVKDVLVDIGRLFQIQDDFLDLYGDPKVTGKVGTDILDGKCSWMIVEALERATLEQKAILQDSYGSPKEGNVEKVQAIYKTLNMKRVFQRFEVKEYDRILKRIQVIQPEPLRKPVKELLDLIYRRKS